MNQYLSPKYTFWQASNVIYDVKYNTRVQQYWWVSQLKSDHIGVMELYAIPDQEGQFRLEYTSYQLSNEIPEKSESLWRFKNEPPYRNTPYRAKHKDYLEKNVYQFWKDRGWMKLTSYAEDSKIKSIWIYPIKYKEAISMKFIITDKGPILIPQSVQQYDFLETNSIGFP